VKKRADSVASEQAEPGGGVTRVIIFGGPGGGAIVAQYLRNLAARAVAYDPVGFLNDYELPGTLISGLPVLGPFSAWTRQPTDTRFIAPLQKVKESARRVALIRDLGVPNARWISVVDPDASVADDAVLGYATHVGPNANVSANARLGNHVGIRGGVYLGHDTWLGDFVFVGANAALAGYVRVEEGAHISPLAAVREGTRIGRYAVVGLGAVVLNDVPTGTVVAGNPAVPIGEVELP
jgi:acetyltransferase EpsM